MSKLYVTEPDVINMQIARKMLPEDWEIIQGDTSFAGADAAGCSALLIRSATTVTDSIKETFPNLQHIIRVGVGVDHIDMDFCTKTGIAVYNAPGANADAVSDYVIGMMFQALRKLHTLTPQDVADWNRFKFTGRSMAGRSIGIVGFGNIGRQIFSKLQGFDCKAFFVHDPFVKKEDLPQGATYAASVDDVLKNSDIVTLHVPLIPSTKYLSSTLHGAVSSAKLISPPTCVTTTWCTSPTPSRVNPSWRNPCSTSRTRLSRRTSPASPKKRTTTW
jgi:phosphoglycerate dehydrogenase-like enzyme